MGYYDFASGEVLTDTRMDEIMRQTTIICSSTTRPSSPITGMRIYETDTDYERSWNGAAWRALPFGVLDRIVDTTGTGIGGYIAGTEVGVNGSTVNFTSYGSDQMYRFSWRFTLNTPTNGLSAFNTYVKKDGSHFENPYPYYVSEAGRAIICTGFTVFQVSSGTYAMSMSIERASGSGGGEIPAGGCFVIEHLGTEP